MYYMLGDTSIHADSTGAKTLPELIKNIEHDHVYIAFMWWDSGIMAYAFRGAPVMNIRTADKRFKAWLKE